MDWIGFTKIGLLHHTLYSSCALGYYLSWTCKEVTRLFLNGETVCFHIENMISIHMMTFLMDPSFPLKRAIIPIQIARLKTQKCGKRGGSSHFEAISEMTQGLRPRTTTNATTVREKSRSALNARLLSSSKEGRGRRAFLPLPSPPSSPTCFLRLTYSFLFPPLSSPSIHPGYSFTVSNGV